jgi:superfamily II DNA or RNA helicase
MKNIGSLFLIIAVPYQTLADQWVDELGIFKIFPLQCYESSAIWRGRFEEAVDLFCSASIDFFACVVVNQTLASESFQSHLSRLPGECVLFIADECHHHGSEGLRKSLPEKTQYRLGLSATPKHYFDDDRTNRIFSFYGDIIYEYGLKEAISDGILAQYNYYVHFVPLDDDEAVEYIELSERISRQYSFAGEKESSGNAALDILLFKRARLVANASNKLKVFEGLIQSITPTPYSLFYCGEGGDDESQVDEITKILTKFGWKISHYTSRQSRQERQQIMNSFRATDIHGLVAMKCLDEGVDVPDCRIAYILASSRNPKQFIQRRGRVLRKAKGKEHAEIHDFVVCLPECPDIDYAAQIKLIKAEMKRVSEFGNLALNRGDVYAHLEPVLKRLGIEYTFC